MPPRVSSFPARPPSPTLPPIPTDGIPRDLGDPVSLMRIARANGDLAGALALAETHLALEPQHAESRACAAECRDRLSDSYSRVIGPRSRTIRVRVSPQKIQDLAIDHRAAFLLSRIDGVSSIEDVLDVSGMPLLDGMRVLAELIENGLVVADEPPPSREPGRIPR